MNKYIEHTLLKQDATEKDLINLFNEAKEYNFFGVCINPCYVKLAKKNLENSDVKVVTVIGFPLGANTTEVKVFETQKAILDGADEIDMVINVTKLKDRDEKFIVEEIKRIKNACSGHNLKVIIETDLLTNEEKVLACKYAIEGGADFVKTSTGFVKGGVGAKAEDVELMFNTVKDAGLRVKASGGIRDKETAQSMIKAGAVRLGTSSGVKIVS
ncbi:deoxyribose-phosphate aldolase [bacterium]|nr:deoxyribose-phosphate aldolase [bacterium]